MLDKKMVIMKLVINDNNKVHTDKFSKLCIK